MKHTRFPVRFRYQALAAFLLLTASCSMHRIDVQQGNIITPEMIAELRPGLSKTQVIRLLGTPLIVDVFDDDRWVYLYSLQTSRGRIERYHVLIEFESGKVVHLEEPALVLELEKQSFSSAP